MGREKMICFFRNVENLIFLRFSCLSRVVCGKFFNAFMNQTASVSEIAALWSRILEKIKSNIPDDSGGMVYDNFFKDTYLNEIRDNKLIVVANSRVACHILANRYKDMIDDVVRQATESNFETVFVCEEDIQKEPEEKKPSFFESSKLNPSFTLKSFVVGPSNRDAYQASLIVSKEPGALYNPLLIYSNSGLGKTHLLHAIGNSIKERSPKTRVLYVTTQDFFDEYVKYVKGDKEGESLKSFFKDSVDVLLVDDIQFLVGKKSTEEMFFSVFQTLYQAGKQIVITSDQHPAQLNGLDERLKTRFSQGLLLSIDPPNKETCEEILKMRIEASGLNVDQFEPEVISYFATKFSANVRELEGALNRLLFYVVNVNPSTHITLETAIDSVRGLIDVKADEKNLSIAKVISIVADYYNLSPAQLTGRIRTSQIALARHIAMYLCRELLDAPYVKIGEAFGGKDHATVMSAIGKVGKMLKTDAGLKQAVNDIKSRIK